MYPTILNFVSISKIQFKWVQALNGYLRNEYEKIELNLTLNDLLRQPHNMELQKQKIHGNWKGIRNPWKRLSTVLSFVFFEQ